MVDRTDHAPLLGEVPSHPETDREKYLFAAFDAAQALGKGNVDALRLATGVGQ